MTLISFGLFTLVVTCLVLVRRSIEERVVRWRLYALRDNLRDAAYRDRSLINSRLFRRLDSNITAHCASLIDTSFWAVLPVFLMDRDGHRKVEEVHLSIQQELCKPENAEVAKLYHQSVLLMTRHLLLRHLFISLAAGITLIGGVALVVFFKWLAERIVSGALVPMASPLKSRSFTSSGGRRVAAG